MGIVYIEPEDYFPEEIRRECKLGEYCESEYEEAEDIPREAVKACVSVIDDKENRHV